VPWSAWQAFERAFVAEQKHLRAAMDAYEADCPNVRERVVGTFRQLAADSARRLAATGQPVPPAFEEAAIDEVLASLPTPEVLRERLTLEHQVGVMQLGSEMWAEARLAADERRRVQEIESEARLARQRTEAAERLVQEQLWGERERVRRQFQAEEQERQREAAVKERLRQLKLKAAQDRLKEVLSPLATTAKCVLHLSEYEKAVGGMQSSARTDGGATSRVVGSLLSWLADPHPGVFIIATANDGRELAPEQIREGRFTPVFVDLPTPEDRAAIFGVHLAKRWRDPAEFDLEQFVSGMLLANAGTSIGGAPAQSVPARRCGHWGALH
jgi:hypothetical protein